MSLIPEGGIKAPHVLVTVALPTDGQGLDDISAQFVIGRYAYVRVHDSTDFIGVVTACEVMNDDRPNT